MTTEEQDHLKLLIFSGVPGSGKTSLAQSYARQMTREGRPTFWLDHDMFESNRVFARELFYLIRDGEDIAQSFKDAAVEIFKPNRAAFLDSLAATSMAQLNMGNNVVVAANFDSKDHWFMDKLVKAVAVTVDRPVDLIGVHVRSSAATNVPRIMERNSTADKGTLADMDPVAFAAQAEKFSVHGPFYSADPSRTNYGHIEVPIWDIARVEKTDAEARKLMRQTEKPAGILIKPQPATGEALYPRRYENNLINLSPHKRHAKREPK